MAKAHVFVVPIPAQGHVTPLMELSHRLVDHGFEVTFVNTEVHHALPAGGAAALGGIHMAFIPDDSCYRQIPGHLDRLVTEVEAAGRPKVKWLIGDMNLQGACFEVAKKLGIRVASFWPASAACLAILLSVPKLVEEGLVSDKGWLVRDETLQLTPGMPPLQTSRMPWMDRRGLPVGGPGTFELVTRSNNYKIKNLVDVVICNSFLEAETGAFELLSKLLSNIPLPIGPLHTDCKFQKSVGNFLPEDESCIKWLNAQPDRSVVYAAFGSMAVFDPCQFEELAKGLELTGRPFLWVVRPDFSPDLSMAWLDEFRKRVAGTGVIVSWCSQQKVLAHRAVACFVSHCGWNSTMEGVRNGVPFVCWPYFCDQYLDQSYITNVWRTGLAVSPGSDGIVTKEELKGKVEQVLGDGDIKERARLFMDASQRCIRESGSSCKNFNKFVNLLSDSSAPALIGNPQVSDTLQTIQTR